jgi:hypothetical protein
VGTLRRATPADAEDLTRLRGLMLQAMGTPALPQQSRRGYGRDVFGALLDWFAELDVPRIDLRATPDGRPLYESFGFQVLGNASMVWTAPGADVPLAGAADGSGPRLR